MFSYPYIMFFILFSIVHTVTGQSNEADGSTALEGIKIV
jgi:fucose 4-O-acetylase-like acetyltransferase